MRILHIISGLGVGGAETLLYRLIRESQGDGTEHMVISLSSFDLMADRIRTAGAEVRILGMLRGAPQPLLIGRMINWIVAFKPDVVQTWMYHADLFGGIAAHAARRILAWREKGSSRFGLLWAIHQTEFPTFSGGPKLGLVAKFCAMVSSRIPDLIVCCAHSAKASHVRGGYCAERMLVIRNGFDTHLFRPLESARISLRQSLGVDEEVPIVGIVGRYHAAKDYGNFVAAIGRVHQQLPKCQYVMIGQDLDRDNRALCDLLDEAGVSGACHLMGPRNDLQLLIPGFDVFCLSSRSEGFPTVVGEAMACGVPCVATDVGDTALLVGNQGRIVPPENPEALASGLLSLLTLSTDEQRSLGALARERIHSLFSIESTWQHYKQAYGAAQKGVWRCAESRAS
jgi:glycosyltransferase involved in cell wall biosynthesis